MATTVRRRVAKRKVRRVVRKVRRIKRVAKRAATKPGVRGVVARGRLRRIARRVSRRRARKGARVRRVVVRKAVARRGVRKARPPSRKPWCVAGCGKRWFALASSRREEDRGAPGRPDRGKKIGRGRNARARPCSRKAESHRIHVKAICRGGGRLLYVDRAQKRRPSRVALLRDRCGRLGPGWRDNLIP